MSDWEYEDPWWMGWVILLILVFCLIVAGFYAL